jgi:uncharacterized protein with HEPN domain
MNDNDLVRLRHMLDAGREALSFIEGRTSEDLRGNRMLLLALIKEIEIIGEAASRISAESKGALPAIPWPLVVGMRNRLIHAYADVNLMVVWSALTIELPELLRELESVLPDTA